MAVYRWAVLKTVHKLSDGVTASRAMARANGRECRQGRAWPNAWPDCAWNFQRLAHCLNYFQSGI
jgi:hypothetical protein